MRDPFESPFRALSARIMKSDRIVLCAHRTPDGDTLGAATALLNWLKREGKHAAGFCISPVPPAFHYLDGAAQFTNDPRAFAGTDLVVILDSGSLRHNGVDRLLPEPRPFLANLDHHASNERFGDLNIIIADASSTAEVVARFFAANRIRVDHRMATSILTGILTDTNNFSNGATSVGAIDIAGRMIAAGARCRDIRRNIHRGHRVETLKLWGRALERLRVNRTRDIAVTYVRHDDLAGLPDDAASGLSNFISASLGAHESVLVLTENPDGTVKGSIRSSQRDTSVISKLAGGGGHAKASGFTIRGRIEETSAGPKIV